MEFEFGFKSDGFRHFSHNPKSGRFTDGFWSNSNLLCGSVWYEVLYWKKWPLQWELL